MTPWLINPLGAKALYRKVARVSEFPFQFLHLGIEEGEGMLLASGIAQLLHSWAGAGCRGVEHPLEGYNLSSGAGKETIDCDGSLCYLPKLYVHVACLPPVPLGYSLTYMAS